MAARRTAVLTAVLVSGSSCAAWVVPASPRRCGDVLALAKPPAARGGGERGPSAAKRSPSRARPARPGGSERRAALRRVCEAVRARSRDDVEALLPERNWSSGEWAAMVQAAGQVGDWACARRLIDRLEGSRAKGARGGSAYAAAYGHAIAACARSSKLQARAVKPHPHLTPRRSGRHRARVLICTEMKPHWRAVPLSAGLSCSSSCGATAARPSSDLSTCSSAARRARASATLLFGCSMTREMRSD